MKVQALIELVLNEAMRLGQRPHGAYRNYWTIYNPIISFFRDKGLEDYSVEVLQEYIDLVTKKYQNGQIKRVRHSMLTTAARRVAHFERTGSYLWNVPKRGTRYELDAYYTGLVNEFITSDDFHPNTVGDLEWVARRYFHWLRERGITDIRQAEQEIIQKYLHDCMEEMKSTSVYNVHLYLKKLYRFLFTRGYTESSYEVFFSFKICRESKLFPAAEDKMVNAILNVLDTQTARLRDIHAGKTPVVILHGKGKKVRSVPLMKETMEHYEQYCIVFHPEEGPYSDRPLFYTKRGNVEKKYQREHDSKVACTIRRDIEKVIS